MENNNSKGNYHQAKKIFFWSCIWKAYFILMVIFSVSFHGNAKESEMSSFIAELATVNSLQAEHDMISNIQQERKVTGRVFDADNKPIPGVTVIVEGTTQGTITDTEGYYRLTIPESAEALLFSFVGMKTLREVIAGRTVIDVVMEAQVVGLEEVVVVGYGEQRKVNLTGAVSTVQSQELVKVPSSNVSEVLIGKATGLLTKQSQGVPGDDFTTLSIRGYDSPLVLVDGIEMSWTRLDPNEIESISILKDAAAAVYGARAGNGVVLITTKRGAIDKPTITYSSNYTYQQPTVVPEIVSSWKYAALLREGELNVGLPYTYSEEDIQKFKDGDDPDYVNANWYDAMFLKWAPMQTHNLNVRGGSDVVKYFISIGYLDQASIYKSGDLKFNRYNARANIDAKITDKLTVSMDLSFRNETRDSPESSFQGGDALANIWTDLKRTQSVWPATLPVPTKGGAYSGSKVSPVAQTISDLAGFQNDRQQYFAGKVGLEYEIPGIKGLVASADLNYAANNKYLKVQDKPFEVFSYNYETGEYTSYGFIGSNELDENFSKYYQLYPLVSLNYDRTFGRHQVSGLLLAEWIDTEYFYLSAGRIDLMSLEIPYMFAGSPNNITNNGGAVETGRASYIGRINYNFQGKYLLEGTFRYDASHKFPKDSRWGFFPSISAGWRISEESFIKDNLSWIDNLKIRASYSMAGDDNVEAFKYLTGYEIRSGSTDVYVFGNQVYRMITSTGLPNPNITWLDMTSYNVGIDARFLRGLIGFEFDLFYRVVDNIFGKPLETYPSTFGAELPSLNLNSTDDRGFELTVNHRNQIGNDFRYSISGNVSYAREKYRRWSETPYDDPDEIRIYKKEGKYTNRWIGYLSDGIFMSQEEIDNHEVDQDQAGNTTLRPGDIKYIDLNGDGVIDWRDQDEIGYGTFPDLYYGLDLQVQYKGISVTAIFQGASMFNNMISDHYAGPLTNWGNPYEFHYKYRWQPDPENPDVNINPEARLPAILGDGQGRSPNNSKTSDFWLQDATYLRLRNLNVSYSLPEKWMQPIGIKNLSVFVAGSNLFTLSKLGIYKKSLDPEATQYQKHYPPVRTVSFGVTVSL